MKLFQKKKKAMGESISHLKPNVDIEVVELGKKTDNIYSSKLERHISATELLISVPTKKGKLVKIGINKEVLITIKTAKGLYQNKASIKKYDLTGNVPFVHISLLQETVKIQRRESFRLKKSIEFNFDLVDKKTDTMLRCESVLLSAGVTIDVSNGGIKFLSNENLQENDMIKILMSINNRSIPAIAKILFKEHIEEEEEKEESYDYCYKCRFENIDIQDKEYISAYIFEEQRLLSRKGKMSK